MLAGSGAACRGTACGCCQLDRWPRRECSLFPLVLGTYLAGPGWYVGLLLFLNVYFLRRCEVESVLCVRDWAWGGSVGRLVRISASLSRVRSGQLVGHTDSEIQKSSEKAKRSLSRPPLAAKEGRSVGRSDSNFASPRCVRRVGRSGEPSRDRENL